eukprot:6655093-Lingulodinium_polyedra.AAC.1
MDTCIWMSFVHGYMYMYVGALLCAIKVRMGIAISGANFVEVEVQGGKVEVAPLIQAGGVAGG